MTRFEKKRVDSVSLLQEFKIFAMKGNMIDLAIGVVIGVAFGKVVSSLVADIIMPPIGLLLGGIDFSSFKFTLQAAHNSQPEVAIKYGTFINTIIDFLIVSIAIFLAIKVMNRLRHEQPSKSTDKECKDCLSQIPRKAKRCKYCTSYID